jgi:hypothetical protein
MEPNKFYRSNPRYSAYFLLAGIVVLTLLLVLAIFMKKWVIAALALFGLGTTIRRRMRYGPVGEIPVIVIHLEQVVFYHFVLAGKQIFTTADIESVHIVGPLEDRRIRVYMKNGEHCDALRSLGKKRMAESVSFLSEWLPTSISIIEEEPPSWQSVIRGDF